MFLDEIASRIASQNIGVVASSIFMGRGAVLPVGDGPFLTIVETGGTGSERTQQNALARPTAQLMVSAGNFKAALDTARKVFNTLGGDDGLHNIDLSGVRYVSLTARQQPYEIGPDQRGRPRVAFNIDATKVPS